MKHNEIQITPAEIAHKMVEIAQLKDGDNILDPYKESGLFRYLPLECNKKFYEGNNFYSSEDLFFDCVIMNPPQSQLYMFLSKAMKITNKIVFCINTCNLIINRIRWILNNNFGITYFYLFEIDYIQGSHVILRCEKGGENILNCAVNTTLCDICGSRCGRGRNGANPNICKKLSTINYESRIKEKHNER